MRYPVGPFDLYRETIDKLTGKGLILVAGDPPNPMTIGWGTIGEIWNKPVFTVLVRPTRFTFGLMEKAKDFTVCVMPEGFNKHLAVCGTKSGRDLDKVRACGFEMTRGTLVGTPYIEQSSIHYECRIIHKHKLDPMMLEDAIIGKYYPNKDFHTVYYGEILGVFKVKGT